MENFENTTQSGSSFAINDEVKSYLLEISKWGKLLAIVGYVGMGFLILLGLGVIVGFSAFSSLAEVGFPMAIMGVVYIILAALYFFPVNYLYRFSVQMKHGLSSNDQLSVNTGFGNLKSLFKFMGIMTIVILSLYALILVIAIPVAIFSGLS